MSHEMTFTAHSLEDIADQFDKRAKECDRQAAMCTTQKHKTHYWGASGAWSTAAAILRSTTITPDIVVDESIKR